MKLRARISPHWEWHWHMCPQQSIPLLCIIDNELDVIQFHKTLSPFIHGSLIKRFISTYDRKDKVFIFAYLMKYTKYHLYDVFGDLEYFVPFDVDYELFDYLLKTYYFKSNPRFCFNILRILFQGRNGLTYAKYLPLLYEIFDSRVGGMTFEIATDNPKLLLLMRDQNRECYRHILLEHTCEFACFIFGCIHIPSSYDLRITMVNDGDLPLEYVVKRFIHDNDLASICRLCREGYIKSFTYDQINRMSHEMIKYARQHSMIPPMWLWHAIKKIIA